MTRILALLLLVPFAAAAQMYKCVDRKGVTHYTDTPQAGCKGAEVEIRSIPSLSGSQVERRDEDFARQEAEFKRRQNERAQAEAQERATIAARCKSLRQERARLSSGRPLSQVNDQGERVYLPDEVRERRLVQLGEAMRACP